MYTEIRALFSRCASTLVQDMIGVMSLIVLLMVSLHLPSFA